MQFKIEQKAKSKNKIYILDHIKQVAKIPDISKAVVKYFTEALDQGQSVINFNTEDQNWLLCLIPSTDPTYLADEKCRKTGAQLLGILNAQKQKNAVICNCSAHEKAPMHLAEGMMMANYQFLKYFKDAIEKTHSFDTVFFDKSCISLKDLSRLEALTFSIYKTRTLVNEPLNFMTAEQLASEFKKSGKTCGFKVTVYNKAKIEAEGMGGILSVNLGSILPPTFTIMEYKPNKPLNKKPIVLVGKGVVYDTGGLSLKPTPASMDRMKSDMSGAAVVHGIMCMVSLLKLPLHVIALVPATENRPGQNAYVPGDIITMYDGTRVEVLNTDAEGRLVLADALHFAKRYKPELVMDFATLTGAASAAVGPMGIVCMGTADKITKEKLTRSGEAQYERLVEMPLWNEYGDLLKSDVADLKNIGGPVGGAITAGKFLEHFTDYPWMHFDIAGVSFATGNKDYITSGGTGYGIRMAVHFLENYFTK